ncbi:winged helix-turn-helix transcriptional regulator [Phreatobacter aquaticus]|uniref:Winged helix-turn-helix transcriptional regulator n=1 Tax=Phreatobacter aquaticus TaxID=2570229 RepID=A0A4D7QTY5_9HYPH|nr:MarR family winged helix-turn-helix transcriptional regulator [Phreatobacter aquaticus]QCK88507.1 winged helix-turn-helix transcriptional regulator [Phreatobacter aquaticus]
MAPKSIRTDVLARLFEQSTRALHSSGHSHGLFPAQWTALRYFSTADRPQCTAMSLARFQGMAFGPVSRTVRTLISKGLLRKAGSAGKGRAELLEVSDEGRLILEQDPLVSVVDALAMSDDAEREALAKALERVLMALQSKVGPDLEAE